MVVVGLTLLRSRAYHLTHLVFRSKNTTTKNVEAAGGGAGEAKDKKDATPVDSKLPAKQFKPPKTTSTARPKSPFERTRYSSASTYSSEEERLFVENLVELVGAPPLPRHCCFAGSRPLTLFPPSQPSRRWFRTI